MTGGYFVDRKQKQPTRAARDDEAASRLCTISEELVRSRS
jgi:hypothetical protein